MAGHSNRESDQPRSAARLIGDTFVLYARFPLLFVALAGAVVVPYDLIVLAATGTGPFARGQVGLGAGLLIQFIGVGLVTPLISALHIHAVVAIRDGRRPRLVSVAKESLVVLPAVSVAVVLSLLGIGVGTIALIVPGIYLWLRWAVVAQAAAVEERGWEAAFRRSQDLTEGHYWQVFGVVFSVLAASFVVNFFVGGAFGHTDTTAASFLVGTALEVVFWSFTALATALLYFDLRTRLELATADALATKEARAEAGVAPTGHPQDPDSYTDEERPPGWYVIPDKPWRMRYWAADGKPGWSRRTAKTPKATLAGWRDLRWTR